MLEVARRTAEEVFIPFTVGGGIRSTDDARRLLRAGADKVSVNTAAVARPSLVAEIADEFGSQCVVVAIDARLRPSGRFEVVTHGGRRPTDLDAVDWAARAEQLGAGEILLTSMDRDGTKEGFDLPLTRAVSDAVNVPVIASGGVGTLDHLAEGVAAGADAVLAASIFHFGEHSIAEAKAALAAAGVRVRPASRPPSAGVASRSWAVPPIPDRRRSARPRRNPDDKLPVEMLNDRIMVRIGAAARGGSAAPRAAS